MLFKGWLGLTNCHLQVFGVSAKAMTEDLEQGDPAETVKKFFEQSTVCVPQKKSTISIQEVVGHVKGSLPELTFYIH